MLQARVSHRLLFCSTDAIFLLIKKNMFECMWRPEIEIRYLSLAYHLIFETGLSVNMERTNSSRPASELETTCDCPSVLGLQECAAATDWCFGGDVYSCLLGSSGLHGTHCSESSPPDPRSQFLKPVRVHCNLMLGLWKIWRQEVCVCNDHSLIQMQM